MVLAALIIIPAIGGLLAWVIGRTNPLAGRFVSISALVIDLGLVASLWARYFSGDPTQTRGTWLAQANVAWIPQFGINFHLGIDGLSLLLVGLTALLGIVALVSSRLEIVERPGLFQANLLWSMAGMIGVFLALDLFLFYFFWELMLVPAYLLFFWSHDQHHAAATKFFVFTQAGSLLMLLAILGLYFIHGRSTGVYTFDYTSLTQTPMAAPVALLLMLGFFIGFAVKLPAMPFHTWLPDAYKEAPTPATIMLAALMAKTGGYGLLRFVFPLFPDAAHTFSPVAMALGAAGVLYGAWLAFAQTDLKRLLAYSSISHMGFVLLGIFAWNAWSLEGAIVQMVAHGVSIGALFLLAGILQERLQTLDIRQMGGLWSRAPRLSAMLLVFALSMLGLPGLGNFVGEFLVMVGTYRVSVPAAVAAALGIILSALYALRLLQHTLFGPIKADRPTADGSAWHVVTLGLLIVVIAWLGLFPQTALNAANQALGNLISIQTGASEATPQAPVAARLGGRRACCASGLLDSGHLGKPGVAP